MLRNRLWFFANVRATLTEQDVPNLDSNQNASIPANWNYEKDDSIKVRNANSKTLERHG